MESTPDYVEGRGRLRGELLSFALVVPTVVHDALVAITTSGITAAVYQLLKTWVDARNGRKLKIKVGDIEVEASQMNEEDVLRIFELLEEKADRKKVRDFLLEANKKEADKREERRPELQ